VRTQESKRIQCTPRSILHVAREHQGFILETQCVQRSIKFVIRGIKCMQSKLCVLRSIKGILRNNKCILKCNTCLLSEPYHRAEKNPRELSAQKTIHLVLHTKVFEVHMEEHRVHIEKQ